MNGTEYAEIYTEKAKIAHIAYAVCEDPRNAEIYLHRARHYEVLAQIARERTTAITEPVQPPAEIIEREVKAEEQARWERMNEIDEAVDYQIAQHLAQMEEEEEDADDYAEPDSEEF